MFSAFHIYQLNKHIPFVFLELWEKDKKSKVIEMLYTQKNVVTVFKFSMPSFLKSSLTRAKMARIAV